MSFEYSPNNQKDNDRRSLRPDSNGDAARNIISADLSAKLQEILDALSGDAIGFIKSEIIIPANTMVVADVNLLSSFSRLDYIMNFKDSPVTVTKSMKVVVQNDSGALTSSVSERMGGAINVLINVTDDSVDAFLEVTNNEAYPLTMTFLKSKI